MINLDEINVEIEKLESQPVTYTTIQRLSWLYTVRDHNTVGQKPTMTGTIPEGDSEFMCACRCGSVSSVMIVMDELMDAINVIQPRLYDAVMRKLKG